MDPATRKRPGSMVPTWLRGSDVAEDIPFEFDPALCAAEARVFAKAALKLLDEGECQAAAGLLFRAFEFAGRA